jgi:hypothetical protein
MANKNGLGSPKPSCTLEDRYFSVLPTLPNMSAKPDTIWHLINKHGIQATRPDEYASTAKMSPFPISTSITL